MIQDKKILIERRAFILDGMIQPVYKYFIDDMLVLTFYTNGHSQTLNAVYHALDMWSKKQLDDLLEGILPSNISLSNHHLQVFRE